MLSELGGIHVLVHTRWSAGSQDLEIPERNRELSSNYPRVKKSHLQSFIVETHIVMVVYMSFSLISSIMQARSGLETRATASLLTTSCYLGYIL